LFVLIAAVGFARPQAEAALTRFEYRQYHMGVTVRIVVYAPNQEAAETACTAAFQRFAELDSVMSDYRINSELTLLCNKAGGPPVKVSRDLYVVLERSQEIARRSGGAFDVTAGPIIRLWRNARKTSILPSPAEIAHARRLSGWRKLRLDRRRQTAQLSVPGMRLDLGGIAKGYAGDCAQAVLRKHGIRRAMVEAGGDIVVTAPPPSADGWKVQVANAALPAQRAEPSGPTEPANSPTLSFSNTAISTSGDVFQSTVIGGKRYSHIVDPRTGRALTDRIQVTVVAKNGFTSDPLSTAVSVLGPKKGAAFARKYPGVKQVFVRTAGKLE
jgi:FAD:protein FMN transferase